MDFFAPVFDNFGIIFAIVGFFFTWLKWSMKKTYATKEEHKFLESKVVQIEQDIKGLATKNDIHDIKMDIQGLSGEMKAIGLISSRTENMVQRQEDYLLRTKS